jgi:hypothetical protein
MAFATLFYGSLSDRYDVVQAGWLQPRALSGGKVELSL